MGYLSPLFMLTIAYIFGTFIKGLFRDDDDRITEACLIGTFFVLITWQIILLLCDQIGVEFSIAFKIFICFLLIMFAISLVLGRKKFIEKMMITSKLTIAPVIIIGIMVVIEVIVFCIIFPNRTGDYSVETVNTVLVTDSIYGFDPLTGAARQTEIPFMEKLNILPYLYAFLANLFGSGSSIMVYRCVPMWVMALNFMVYGLWADIFFGNKAKRGYEIAVFIMGIGALNICGTFSNDSIFYYLTLKGFSGVTFCYSVLIPFVVYEFFTMFKNKNYRKVAYIFMCGICVPLVTTFQKGTVSFLLVSVMCLIIALGYKIRRNVKWS